MNIEIAAGLVTSLPFPPERLSYHLSRIFGNSLDRINMKVFYSQKYTELRPSMWSDTVRMMLPYLHRLKLLKPLGRPADSLLKLSIVPYNRNLDLENGLKFLSDLLWLVLEQRTVLAIRFDDAFNCECEFWLLSDLLWIDLSDRHV